MRKLLTYTIVFAAMASAQGVAAQNPSCKQIDQAISANEDFVEVALGIDNLPLPPALDKIKATLALVKNQLSPAAVTQSAVQVKTIEDQIVAGNLPLAAVAAIENYKVLVKAYDLRLTTTLDTAMLDFAGFKLLGLTADKTLDWPAISETVQTSKLNWENTRAALKDQAVIDLVDSTHTSLSAALQAKDAAWLGSAAQILLDSVDLIERESKNASKSACK